MVLRQAAAARGATDLFLFTRAAVLFRLLSRIGRSPDGRGSKPEKRMDMNPGGEPVMPAGALWIDVGWLADSTTVEKQPDTRFAAGCSV